MDMITATTTADTVAVDRHSIGFAPTSSVVLTQLEQHNVTATLRIDARPDIPADFWQPKSRSTCTASRASPECCCSASKMTEQ